MGKIKTLKEVRKQILKESAIETANIDYFEGWDHAMGDALRIIDLQISKLKEAKKSRTLTMDDYAKKVEESKLFESRKFKSEWDKIPLAFKDYYKNNDPNIPYGKEKSYKTFEDLDFLPTDCLTLIRAGLEFDNNYGVSVVTESAVSMNDLYELAVLKGGSLCYNSGITEDVFRYQTSEEVTEIMKKIQELK